MKRITVLFFLFLFGALEMGFAQNKSIQGVVIDGATNNPMIGASILAPGSQAGTTSGVDGKFQLTLPASVSTIQISFIGYITQTLAPSTNMRVVLQPDAENIDEVVVIGYGAVKKSDLTGSVASVKSSELMKSSPVNAQQGMVGRVAGVNILANDGAPGAGMTVQIRGTNSFLGNTDPLYVIDGVPMTTSNAQESVSLDADNISSRNALSFLNPADIESMEILKDASSTAIYGSRGSNGVILITTKSGRDGGAKVNLSYNLSVSQVSNTLRMLSSREYAEMANLAYINTQLINGAATVSPGAVPHPGSTSEVTGEYSKGPEDYDSNNHTYWQDQVFRTAVSHDLNLNISGSGKGIDYAISGGYLTQQGTVINSDYTRYNFKVSLNKEVKKWLKVGTSTNFSYALSNMLKNATNSSNNGNEGVIRSALYYPATYQMGDTQADEDRYKMVTNPVMYANALNQNKNYNIYTSNYAQFTLAKGLLFKTSLGYSASINFANQYYNRNLWEGEEPINGKSSAGDNTWSSLAFDNLLMFNRDFGKHNVSATIGTSWESSDWYNKGVVVQGFGSDLTNGWLLGDAGKMTSANSSKGESKLFSIIMRAAYNYDSRYYLTFTAREDFSSKFAKGNRASFFPSIGVSWRASQEKFMREGKIGNIITNLKLRYSYGLAGNQAIGSYATFANMGSANYPFGGTVINGFATDIYNPGNKDLKWETTYQHDAGIDLQLFHRVDLTVDLYHKRTEDLLYYQQKATSTGLSQVLSNLGSVQNRGLEITLNANIISRKDMQWSVGGNIAFNENEITDLGVGRQFPNTLWNSYRPFVLDKGRPIGQLIGFVEEGIWASRDEVIGSKQFQKIYPGYTIESNDVSTETIIRQKWVGEIRYKDLTNDDSITDDDMEYLGNTNPKFTYGFNTSFSYKGFDFNALFQGVYGNKIINQPLFRWYNSGETRNVPVDIANRIWSVENLHGTAPKLYTTYDRKLRMSSRFLEDGSYLKLRTLSVGYTFNNPFKGVGNIRISFSGNNLWTITDYSGYDPEVNSFGSDPTTRGIDNGAYPQSRSYVFGINLTF
ncbi:MAG: TonB-dependent receptor [Alistipes sp.]